MENENTQYTTAVTNLEMYFEKCGYKILSMIPSKKTPKGIEFLITDAEKQSAVNTSPRTVRDMLRDTEFPAGEGEDTRDLFSVKNDLFYSLLNMITPTPVTQESCISDKYKFTYKGIPVEVVYKQSEQNPGRVGKIRPWVLSSGEEGEEES